ILRQLDGSPLRHGDEHDDVVRIDGWEERERQTSRADPAEREREDRDGDREAEIAPPESAFENGPVVTSGDDLEAACDAVLDPCEEGERPTLAARRLLRTKMREMPRQDEERFAEREEERRNDDERDHPHDLAVSPRDDEERHEGGDRRQDGEGHGKRDLLRALRAGVDARLSSPDARADVVGDDDRVIDHDPKDDDEREERHQVDRASERGHEPDRAEKRYRDSERHPERERRPKEERERHEDEDEPHAPVPDHEVEAALED